ncbi:MAG: VOC family protein [Sphingosinicella sp.]
MSASGSFIWYELWTPDREAARAFYAKVVGWRIGDPGAKDLSGEPYLMIQAGGQAVGGMIQLGPEMPAGVGAGWYGYIAVDDADAMAQRVESAGGRIVMGPGDIPEAGRFAMVADPGGAIFYMLTPKMPEGAPPPPPRARRTPGQVDWHELYSAAGQEKAFAFYSSLFGWKAHQEMPMGPMGTYRIFGYAGDEDQWGGMMDKPANVPASAWNFYVYVDGIDAAAERVRAAGGEVIVGPMEVPDGSFVLQGRDPQGASFALVSKVR